MNLAERRRILAQAGTAEQWDFEWDYTMGKLEDMAGWTGYVSRGTGSSVMTESGEKLCTGAGPTQDGSQYIISPQSTNALYSFSNGYGVIEVVTSGVYYPTNAENLRITAFASSSKRIGLLQSNGKWRILNTSLVQNCTPIADVVDNIEYKVRIVFKDVTADIYINDVLVKADFSTSATLYGSMNSLVHQNGHGPDYYAVIRSYRIKNGRI